MLFRCHKTNWNLCLFGGFIFIYLFGLRFFFSSLQHLRFFFCAFLINEIWYFSIGSSVAKKWRRYSCIRWLFPCDWKPKTIDNNVTENRAGPKAMKRLNVEMLICLCKNDTLTQHAQQHTSIYIYKWKQAAMMLIALIVYKSAIM